MSATVPSWILMLIMVLMLVNGFEVKWRRRRCLEHVNGSKIPVRFHLIISLSIPCKFMLRTSMLIQCLISLMVEAFLSSSEPQTFS